MRKISQQVAYKRYFGTAKHRVEKFTYGPYQIEQEINTFHKDETGKKNIYDYPELNAELNTMKALLKTYYKTHIREKMFEYELVK